MSIALSLPSLGFEGVDMFCGSGGFTESANKTGEAKVILAINHDEQAIIDHSENHPDVDHIIYDITKVRDDVLLPYRSRTNFISMSAECTHHSGAAGGRPRDADSRMLSDELIRYAHILNPEYCFVENVREILTWGPLTKDNKPDPNRKGEYYQRWIRKMKAIGYVNYEFRLLNSADYGAPTRRTRYFGVFSREGCPIKFPEPTHNKNGTGGLKKWVACKNYIRLEDEGKSIFGRKKPLADNTLRRIAYGLQRYVLTKEEMDYYITYYGMENEGNSMNEPIRTITTVDRHAKIHVEKRNFVTQHIHGASNAGSGMNVPINTILTRCEKSIVSVDRFMLRYFGRENAVNSLDGPMPTICTNNQTAKVDVSKVLGDHSCPVDDAIAVEKRQFFDKYFGNKYNVGSLDNPYHTIVTQESTALTTVEILDRMIVDIKMRFMYDQELKELQGFPADYKLGGTSRQVKKHIGNSVNPQVGRALILSNCRAYKYRNHVQFQEA